MNKLTPEIMLELTKNMPMKQIDVGGSGYLQRYYAGTFRDGKDLWLHRFLSSDGDRHLHCHPYNFTTIMLCGGYTEEYRRNDGITDWRVTIPNPNSSLSAMLQPILENILRAPPEFLCHSNALIHHSDGGRHITVFDWHRIAAVEPETWTAMIVDPHRLPYWFFDDGQGNTETMKASPRNWHKDYGVRNENNRG